MCLPSKNYAEYFTKFNDFKVSRYFGCMKNTIFAIKIGLKMSVMSKEKERIMKSKGRMEREDKLQRA